jgi:hypothetical protein
MPDLKTLQLRITKIYRFNTVFVLVKRNSGQLKLNVIHIGVDFGWCVFGNRFDFFFFKQLWDPSC